MKMLQQNLHIIDPLSCIQNLFWVIDLSLIMFDTSWGIYSIPKESKYTPAFMSINNEARCILLPFLSSRFMTYAPSFILGKLFFEEAPLFLGS